MSKKLKIIIIVSSLVVLIGIGLTIYFVSSDDKATDSYQPIVINEAELVECEDNIQSTKTYCDDEGRLIKTEYYDDKGDLEVSSIYEYNGDVIKCMFIAEPSHSSYVTPMPSTTSIQYECDTEGRVIKASEYDIGGGGKLVSYTLHTFDDEGNKIKIEHYADYENDNWSEIYEYDNEGNKIKTERYDTDGNFIKIDYYDAEGKLIKREQYDADGNLLD